MVKSRHRHNYYFEKVTDSMNNTIISLSNKLEKQTSKKNRATLMIAELKKENQQLESTILLMEENAKSTNKYFTDKHNHYKKMFGFTEIGVLNRNQDLEKMLKETTQENRFLKSQLRDKEKEDFLLSEFLREKSLTEEASIYLLDNMEEEE